MVGVRSPIPGSSRGVFLTSKLKFHTSFTIAEAENLLQQAEAKREALDKKYAEMVEGIAWFPKPTMDVKRPYTRIEFYAQRLAAVNEDIQSLERAMDIAARGYDTVTSEKMWEMAEQMGLKYPQTEAHQD